jgi:uncharacterized membrane protein YccC
MEPTLGKGSEKISAQVRQLIEKFSTVLRIQRLNTGKVAKYVWHLKTTAERLKELNRSDGGLSNATKDDLEDVISSGSHSSNHAKKVG